MNFEVLIGILVLMILFIIWVVVDKLNAEKVLQISLNIKALKNLNEQYCFEKYFKRTYKINHKTRSKAGLMKLSLDDIISYHIENNINGFRDDLNKMVNNKTKYAEYTNQVQQLNEQTTSLEITRIKMKEETFLKYERKLIRKLSIKNRFDLKAIVCAYYRSPKGRNYYQKKRRFKNEQLLDLFNEWKKKKNYQVSARFERSKMSDSLRFDVLKRDAYQCKICGATARDGAKLHVDHIRPVSKGGKTEYHNLQTLCERCNLGKSNKE